MVPSPKQNPGTIVIIGGGISGLACAWRLRKLGLPALLLERSQRFGGLIATREMNGFHFDIGPQSFLAGESLLALIGELNLTDQLRKAPPRSPRYILHRGRLTPLSLGPAGLLGTPLIGWGTKLRLISEPFRRSHPPDGDESIAAFVRRKVGADFLANVVAPFVSGVYAGDPEKLSLASAFPAVHRFEQQSGSVIRGAIKSQRESRGPRASLCNFAGGVPTLTEALGTQLGACARRGVETVAIRQRAVDPAAGFEVICRQDGAELSIEAAAVVLATPAQQAGQLLCGVEPQFAPILDQIEYAGVVQVSAGYRLDKMSPLGVSRKPGEPLQGFGFLVPRAEGLRVLGTVWNSLLFAGRAPNAMEGGAPENLGAFTSFLGGATDPALVHMDEGEIAAIARAEVGKVMGTSDAPVAEHVSRWERAIPQYNLGHGRIMTALSELCSLRPGIFLAGNYLTGPAIGACVEHSNVVADEVAKFIATSATP